MQPIFKLECQYYNNIKKFCYGNIVNFNYKLILKFCAEIDLIVTHVINT